MKRYRDLNSFEYVYVDCKVFPAHKEVSAEICYGWPMDITYVGKVDGSVKIKKASEIVMESFI